MATAVKEQAVKDAERLLDTVWRSRLRGIPVDPIQIARELGIDVLEAHLSPDVSAAIVKRQGQDPQIVLNAMDHRNRKRFSCAHELGHYSKRQDDPDRYEYVDYRDIFSSTGTSPEERYANEFAACLLMPEQDVRAAKRSGMTEVELAWYFDVSREAMHFRLKNLGLI